MTKIDKKKIVGLYKKEMYKNISFIKNVLKENNLYTSQNIKIYENLLVKSSNMIAQKWERQEKYIRTEFVMNSFSDLYPKKAISLSLSIDAMINILDDLLDEELSKEVKMFYILEYLRVFSLYSYKAPNKNIQIKMCWYFNKLITLAVLEKVIMDLVKKEKDIKKIIKLSKDLLFVRAHDIDIFVEIAIDALTSPIEEKELLLLARSFRAVNILKKDIIDIKHDISQSQETLMTYLSGKDGFSFEVYLEKLLNVILKETKKPLGTKAYLSKNNPYNGFYNMLNEEQDFILRYIQGKNYND